MELYDITNFQCSKLVTNAYSTSFSLGIKTLHKRFHYPIYAIYGFVRYADEIVDTFHEYNKKDLLERFKSEALLAIEEKISLNPILHSFQLVANKYNIEESLILAFIKSMEMDLSKQEYKVEQYEEYIFGSAEVVGLMCLRVFCEGDEKTYERLKGSAQKLGAAFQKVNFLRDIKSDFQDRGRVYFPGVDFDNFNKQTKKIIEEDIQKDFDDAYNGIVNLPDGSRLGVYLAYIYYLKLFKKIKKCPVSEILQGRIRIPDNLKFALLVKTYFRHQFNYL